MAAMIWPFPALKLGIKTASELSGEYNSHVPVGRSILRKEKKTLLIFIHKLSFLLFKLGSQTVSVLGGG